MTVKWHNWWNASKTAAAVAAIDPVVSHGSWMENFLWTRVHGVAAPDGQKPMIDIDRLRLMDAAGVRAYVGMAVLAVPTISRMSKCCTCGLWV